MSNIHVYPRATIDAMAARGYPESLTGLLVDAPHHPVLLAEGGGEWRLEIAWMRWRHLLGRRVRVRGTRDGIDLIRVDSIGAA